jgi:hypothetical protein
MTIPVSMHPAAVLRRIIARQYPAYHCGDGQFIRAATKKRRKEQTEGHCPNTAKKTGSAK